MRKLLVLCGWLFAVAFVADSNCARAGNFISYVSSTGTTNTGSCATPATACNNFDYALTQTFANGVIECVDAGTYYWDFTLSQSVTIDCAGATTVGWITISGSGIVVRLRNLTMINNDLGGIAVNVQNLAALYIENCDILNYTFAESIGVKFAPSANAELFISNSIISNSGSSTSDASPNLSGGIYIAPPAGVTANVSINRSEIIGNYFGIVGDARPGGAIHATVSNSVVSGNGQHGIVAISSGSPALIAVDQTQVSGNVYGLAASGNGAAISARNTTVFNNATGLFTQNNGSLYTYGTNSVSANTTNGAFTHTLALQ